MKQNFTIQSWHKIGRLLTANLCAIVIVSSSWAAPLNESSMIDDYTTNTQQNTRTVKGSVKDKTGEPLVGAIVMIKGTSAAAVVDANGNYSIKFNDKIAILTVSYLGYKTFESIITQETINVVMDVDTQMIDEVVVTAQGSQRKESVVGSISTLNVDNISLPVGKLSTALGGQVAGIITVQTSGEPGSGADFYIRGISTYGENKQPMVIIDDVERSLDLVNVDDIESFSVLKDASATAVYGVRGGNGAIIIRTKKGMQGRPAVSVKYESGILTPMKRPELVGAGDFARLYNQAVGYDYYGSRAMEQYAMASDAPGRDNNLYPNVNWLDELFSKYAQNQKVNASITGGGEIATYYVSGSFYNEGSIFRQDSGNEYKSSVRYQKTNFLSNVEVAVTPLTKVRLNVSNIFEKRNEPGHGTGDVWGYGFGTSANAFPTYYTDDITGDWLAWSGPSAGSGMNPYNSLMNSGYKETFWTTSQASVGLTQKFGNAIPGLTLTGLFAWDSKNFNVVARTKTVSQYIAQGRDDDGNLILQESVKGNNTLGYDTPTGSAGSDENKTYYTNNYKKTFLKTSLNYAKVFNQVHRFGAMLSYEHSIKTYVAKSDKYISLPYKNQGLSAILSYDYDSRYLIQADAGYNGSENFSPGKRFGFFPAVALGWIVSNEKFMKPYQDVVSWVKIRASYGLNGWDQIGGTRRFIYNSTIKEDGGGYPGMGENGDYKPGAGIAIGEMANPNVSWEEIKKLDIGIEVNFFKDALKFQVDYFNNDRSGIFLKRGMLPEIAGIASYPYVNVGRMVARGIDGSIEFMKRYGELTLTGRGSFTYSRNVVKDDDTPDWQYLYQNTIGQASGQPRGLISDGLFIDENDIASSATQTFGPVRPGDIKYRDINGDGKIDASDRVPIGYTSLPEIMYGFGATANWRGIDLGIQFAGISHSSIMMSGGAVRPFESGNVQRSSFLQDIYDNIWTEANPNPNAIYPRVSLTSNPNNNQTSDYWQRDRSYLRLKSAEIGYSIPKKALEKIKLQSVRIYAQGLNLLTISSFQLWDPENGGGQGSAYPLNTTINLGIQIRY